LGHCHDLGSSHHGGAHHALAAFRFQIHDGAVDRSENGGFEEVLLGPGQRRLGLVRLMSGGFKPGLADIQGGARGQKVGFGNQLLAEELLEPGEFELRLLQFGPAQFHARQRGTEGRICGIAIGNVGIRFDADQQVALFHRLTLAHRQIDNLAADLRIDDHLGDGLDLACGHHQLGQVTAGPPPQFER
jgi:hypothetical protein